MQSPVVKFLEGYLVDSLKRYGRSRLARNQMGFVENVSVDTCKYGLFSRLAELRRKNKPCFACFIDFSSAYNRVDRSVVW